MPYIIKCWISVDLDPEVVKENMCETYKQAKLELEHDEFMQPDNKYEIAEVDEDGKDI